MTNKTQSETTSKLDAYIRENKADALIAFVRKHPEIDLNDTDCLEIAINARKANLIDVLVKLGCDINKPCNLKNETHLYRIMSGSVYDNFISIKAEMVLKAGANPNLGVVINSKPNSTSDAQVLACSTSPLLLAIERSQLPVAKLLIKYGANVNQTDSDGYTPLIRAAEKGYDEMVKLLLNIGADATIPAPSGRTILQVAAQQSTRNLLTEAGRAVSSGVWPWKMFTSFTSASGNVANTPVAAAAIVEEMPTEKCIAASVGVSGEKADSSSDCKATDCKTSPPYAAPAPTIAFPPPTTVVAAAASSAHATVSVQQGVYCGEVGDCTDSGAAALEE